MEFLIFLYKEYKELYKEYQEIIADFCPNQRGLFAVCQGSDFNRNPHSYCSSQFCYPARAEAGTILHQQLGNGLFFLGEQ